MINKLPSSIFGPPMEVLNQDEDIYNSTVRCLHCGKPATYGDLYMICGYVGCLNEISPGKTCFEDLRENVLFAKEHDYETYVNSGVYNYYNKK